MTKANKLSVNILKDQLEQKRLMDINTQKNQLKAEMGTYLACVQHHLNGRGYFPYIQYFGMLGFAPRPH